MTVTDSIFPGLVGATATFLLVQGREVWRNRRNLPLEVVGGKVFYAHGGWGFGAMGGEYRWLYDWIAPEGQEPKRYEEDSEGNPVEEGETADADTNLVVLLDIILQNRSWLDDAITSCRLVLGSRKSGAPNCPAYVTLDQEFFGANVPAHNLEDLHLMFRFDGNCLAMNRAALGVP